jgi:aspartate/methionine/tyrosine aminotransferase
MVWAQTVPKGARIDLTRSGVDDFVDDAVQSGPFAGAVPIRELTRRDRMLESIDEFVQAVADRYGVGPECVTPSFGASQSIMHAMFALVRAGDHVIVERPTYEPLHRVPELLGASVSRFERTYEDGWLPVAENLARLMTPRTRVVVLSNFHNPSHVAIDAERLAAISEMAARVGAVLMVDEVYMDYAFDKDGAYPWRPACLAVDNAVSWSSSTKAFGFGAVRAGWIVTRDPAVASAMRDAQAFFQVAIPPAVAQLGRLVLQQAPALMARIQGPLGEGRAVMDEWIASEERVEWVPPSGGASGLVKLPNLMDDGQFAARLRERFDVQVVPGSFFECPGFVRVSFAVDPAQLRTALAHASDVLDELS